MIFAWGVTEPYLQNHQDGQGEEEEDCLVGAVWTLARVPATAHVHQTRPGSDPREGIPEGDSWVLGGERVYGGREIEWTGGFSYPQDTHLTLLVTSTPGFSWDIA